MTNLSKTGSVESMPHEGRNNNMSNKLRTYKLFKDQFQLEHYLKCQLPNKHRAALTKLRVSCHKLAIETGRYHKPAPLPVDHRLCSVAGFMKLLDCILFWLGKDFHFVAIMRTAQPLREIYISYYFSRLKTVLDLVCGWKKGSISHLKLLMRSYQYVVKHYCGKY